MPARTPVSVPYSHPYIRVPAIVLAGNIVEFAFGGLGLIPAERAAKVVAEGVTLELHDLLFLPAAAALLVRFFRSGAGHLLKMMNGSPAAMTTSSLPPARPAPALSASPRPGRRVTSRTPAALSPNRSRLTGAGTALDDLPDQQRRGKDAVAFHEPQRGPVRVATGDQPRQAARHDGSLILDLGH
jgi:hypothetical protein